jgi:hypothetical protein
MANIELDGANKKIKVDSGDLTLDVPGDIILDADGADLVFADGGTNILKVTNSSSDVVFQPQVDAKDIIFKQYDGTTVATVEDNGTFNIPTDKLAINGTAVTSTAAELNILDGVTSTAAELNILDGVTSTTTELNILDGVTATASELNLLDGGTSVGSSITLADADGVVVNDGGTMKTIPASDIKTYAAGGRATLLSTTTLNSTANVAFDNSLITSTYDNYLITLENVHCGSGNVEVTIHVSVDNGSSLYNSAGDYRFANLTIHEDQSNDSVSNRASASSDKIGITGNRVNNGNDAALKIDATVECFSLNSSSWKKFLTRAMFSDTTDPPNLYYEHTLALFDGSQSAVNYLKIMPSNGNFASGKIKLFGLK